MAKAVAKNTEEIWTINDAFRHLIKELGLPSQVALRLMTEKIQTTRLPVLVNGHAAPRPDWMAVALIDGEVQIVSTGSGLGWDPKAYVFSVAADDVRRMGRPKATKATRKKRQPVKLNRVLALIGGEPRIKPDTQPNEAERLIGQLYLKQFGGTVSRDVIAGALKEWRSRK